MGFFKKLLSLAEAKQKGDLKIDRLAESIKDKLYDCISKGQIPCYEMRLSDFDLYDKDLLISKIEEKSGLKFVELSQYYNTWSSRHYVYINMST